MEKSTKELLNELQKAGDFFEFVSENQTEFEPITLTEYLGRMLDKCR